MQPNDFIARLKEYPLASHKAWDQKNKRAVLKLDWNESNVALPLSIRWEVIKFVFGGPTHWYPDIANQKLINALADYVHMPAAYVQYFAGEDAALDYVVRAYVAPGDEVALIAPTYDNFRVYVESVGAVPRFVTGSDIFTGDVAGIEAQLSEKTRMVYLVNPNNPTGVTYSSLDIERLLKSFPNTLFMVDEAYGEFGCASVAPLTATYNNLIVGRSLSKAFGLASFRLGYIVTDPQNLIHINKIRNGKSISALAQVAALAALKNPAYMHRYIEEVARSRAYLCTELSAMGFGVRDTPANFILFTVPDVKAFCEALQTQNVYIRSLSHLPLMEKYVRVTVGSMESARTFVEITHALIRDGKITNPEN